MSPKGKFRLSYYNFNQSFFIHLIRDFKTFKLSLFDCICAVFHQCVYKCPIREMHFFKKAVMSVDKLLHNSYNKSRGLVKRNVRGAPTPTEI